LCLSFSGGPLNQGEVSFFLPGRFGKKIASDATWVLPDQRVANFKEATIGPSGQGHADVIRWVRLRRYPVTNSFGVGVSKTVDGLVIVPDHREYRAPSHKFNETLIRAIQILVLIHDYVIEGGLS